MSLLRAATAAFFAVQSVSAIFGPIGTSKPNLPGGSVANDQPPGTFFQGRSPPYPTSDWWAAYAASPNQDAIVGGPFPFQSRCLATGIQYGISSSRDFDGTSLHQPSNMEWSASFVGHSGAAKDHKAVSWDAQTVTVQYSSADSAMNVFNVPGSPYMTFNYTTAFPTFTSLSGKITNVNAKTVTPGVITCESAVKYKIVTAGATYLLYSLRGAITLCTDKSSIPTLLTSQQRISGVMRMAKLVDAAHEATLDTYSPNYATGVTLDYTFPSSNSANLVFAWKVVGDASKLLMLSWPHHRKSLVSPNYLSSSALSYLTTKGWMYPVLGAKWTMSYTLPTIDFNAPRAPHSSCKDDIVAAVAYEVGNLGTPPRPGDFYFWGGSVAAASRLALIADQVGRSDLVAKVVAYLTTTLGYWTDRSYTNVRAAYETAWGGIINKDGANNFWVDFGNGYYNDHHFHYGYFLSAAAVVAKFNPSWLQASNGLGTNNDFLSWLARDIANPSVSGDPYFPLTRHRDWMAGHSWASGIANGGGGRDQESVGEAVNGYYGVLLYATVTNNTNLRNYARLLIATEQQAAQTYWHLYPSMKSTDSLNPYPESNVRKLITMGNVYDWQAGAFLFWGSQKSEIAAIQILPVTPINEYMYDAEWTSNVLSYVVDELDDDDVDDAWKAVIYQAYGNGNPQKAMSLSSTLSSWGSGNSFSNQLYFIATRPNPSGNDICTSAQDGPTGTWVLQDVKTGKYVTSTSSRSNLAADTTTAGLAAPFTLASVPGGTTIQANATTQFVTADQSGNYSLAASRASASAWEIFSFRLQSGSSDQYTIVARSNKKFITLNGDGALMPSASSASAATVFRLVTPPAPIVYAGPSGTWALQAVSTGKYVSSLSSRTELYADTTVGALAHAWTFGSAQGASTIQSNVTKQFVTADIGGTSALAASRGSAQGWEVFTFVLKDGTTDQYIISAGSNSKFVALDSKGALIPSSSLATGASAFRLVTPPTPDNPTGAYYIQDMATQKYLVTTGSLSQLVASTSSKATATVFNFTGSALSIQSVTNKQFVTSEPAGGSALSAARTVASGWEKFWVDKKAGTVVMIIAQVNNLYLSTSRSGAVYNNATSSDNASAYNLVKA